MCRYCIQAAYDFQEIAAILDDMASDEEQEEHPNHKFVTCFRGRAEMCRDHADLYDPKAGYTRKDLKVEKCSGKSSSPLLSACLKARQRSTSAKTTKR